MAFEIEAKARILEPKRLTTLRDELNRRGAFQRSFLKQDIYYAPEGAKGCDDSLIRLRFSGDDHGKAVVTRKEKSLLGRVEVNKEFEFTVEPADVFEKMLSSIGFSKYIEKVKEGESWILDDGVHAELCDVKGLGWFLEIELVLDPDKGKVLEKKALTDSLIDIFHQLGIDEAALVEEYYIDLLEREKQLGNGDG